MSETSIIEKYFPLLTPVQKVQFGKLKELYLIWNSQINVISRKDMDAFYEHHVLHSLSIAKIISFKKGSHITDVGTGGGFPGIPLAILFPDVHFYLVDSIGKKIKVVNAVINELQLSNIKAKQLRAEDIKEKTDFVLSRAVVTLPVLYEWVKNKFKKNSFNDLPNGIIALKGGDIKEEVEKFDDKTKVYEIKNYFKEDFFETKKMIYLPAFS